jgi:hypothetical protein
MATDKEIIEHLLTALEKALIEQTMLLTMIATYREHFPAIGDWEKDLEKLKVEKGPDVSKLFSRLRDAIKHSRDMEKTLRQLLKDTRPKGPVH